MTLSPERFKKWVNRSSYSLRMAIGRKSRSPFVNHPNSPMIVHGSHHKVGTSWIKVVLQSVAREYGLKFQSCQQADLLSDTDIFFQSHSRFNVSAFAFFRGSHMIRDPRDVVVSGYYYHLWTNEAWANRPMSSFSQNARQAWAHVPFDQAGDMSYKEFLNSLDRETGLAMEICRASTTFMRELRQWDYQQPEFFEIRYETLIENEASVFEALFRHYGFNEKAVARCVELAEACSFSKRTKRALGTVDGRSHMRSGLPGQWRAEWNEAHKSLFKSLNGDALIRMGYESNLNW